MNIYFTFRLSSWKVYWFKLHKLLHIISLSAWIKWCCYNNVAVTLIIEQLSMNTHTHSHSHTLTHSHTHTHTHTHTHSHTHTLAHSHTRTLAHSHTHTYIYSYSLSHTHANTQACGSTPDFLQVRLHQISCWQVV